jgi:hypothetical protein
VCFIFFSPETFSSLQIPYVLGGVSLQLTAQLMQPGYRFERLSGDSATNYFTSPRNQVLTPAVGFFSSLKVAMCQ